ncbi:MAG: SAM-dependent chlorinase/fluorinase [Bryobacteraceae bacterium]|nr:SAM-dependent chlorinase/fluorinase [Bryobacteraceae bacterium]
MPRRLITLTTDFGLSDHFAGAMKGVILGIAPNAEIVDITHEVTPFAIREGAFVIAQAYPYFPRGTIHVAVVDPGVGTSRRPILVEAAGQYFIGPDNGLLSMVYSREKHRARHIAAAKYFLPQVSGTFHGRDIFAPVAAHLARGVRPAQFGKRIEDHLRPNFEKPVRTGKRYWSGAVLKVDRFGNLITNFRLDEFPELQSRPFEMIVGLRSVTRLVATFAESPAGELALVAGSAGYLEVALNRGSAASLLKIGAGSPLELALL